MTLPPDTAYALLLSTLASDPAIPRPAGGEAQQSLAAIPIDAPERVMSLTTLA